jgi:hypothetical protein
LKFHRIVKGALPFKGVLVLPGQRFILHEPLERASRLIIDLDFFRAGPGFAFELLGGHEEVEERNQGRIHGGQEGLFLEACEPVITDIFTDDGAVFLFDEAVVIVLVIAAASEGEALLFAPDFGGVVDKLAAVVTVELQHGAGDGVSDVRESLESPGMGVIEEGTEFRPA